MMALRSILVSKHYPPYYSPQTLISSRSHGQRKPIKEMIPQKLLQSNYVSRRRIGVIASLTCLLLTNEATVLSGEMAYGLDLRLVAPEQTLEEAESEVENHAKALLQVKDLIESKSWREVQKELRKSSSLLKQDIYTIIQGKPGTRRPQLRKLYSNLFNNVTKLDYAARDEDASRVWQCYDNIVLALNDILSKL